MWGSKISTCIITLVLYFGGQWDGAKSLYELLDFTGIPKELQRMVNDYQVHIPEALSDRILAENDSSVLTNWLKLAAKSNTLVDFTKNM